MAINLNDLYTSLTQKEANVLPDIKFNYIRRKDFQQNKDLLTELVQNNPYNIKYLMDELFNPIYSETFSFKMPKNRAETIDGKEYVRIELNFRNRGQNQQYFKIHVFSRGYKVPDEEFKFVGDDLLVSLDYVYYSGTINVIIFKGYNNIKYERIDITTSHATYTDSVPLENLGKNYYSNTDYSIYLRLSSEDYFKPISNYTTTINGTNLDIEVTESLTSGDSLMIMNNNINYFDKVTGTGNGTFKEIPLHFENDNFEEVTLPIENREEIILFDKDGKKIHESKYAIDFTDEPKLILVDEYKELEMIISGTNSFYTGTISDDGMYFLNNDNPLTKGNLDIYLEGMRLNKYQYKLLSDNLIYINPQMLETGEVYDIEVINYSKATEFEYDLLSEYTTNGSAMQNALDNYTETEIRDYVVNNGSHIKFDK
jgi:hypothetical protein